MIKICISFSIGMMAVLTDGADNVVKDWTFYPIQKVSTGSINDGVLSIENKDGGRGYYNSKPFVVKPGASYQFSVTVKTKNTAAKAVFAKVFWFQGPDCRFQSKQNSGDETIRIGGTKNWTTLPAIGGVKVPSDANIAVIRLETDSPPLTVAKTASWDDVLLNAGDDFPDTFWTKWRGIFFTAIKDDKDKISGGNSIKLLSNKLKLCALNSKQIEFEPGDYQIRFYAKTDYGSAKSLTPFYLYLNDKIAVPLNASPAWCEYTNNFKVAKPAKGYLSLKLYLPPEKSLWVDKLRILRVSKKNGDKDESQVLFKNIVFEEVK